MGPGTDEALRQRLGTGSGHRGSSASKRKAMPLRGLAQTRPCGQTPLHLEQGLGTGSGHRASSPSKRTSMPLKGLAQTRPCGQTPLHLEQGLGTGSGRRASSPSKHTAMPLKGLAQRACPGLRGHRWGCWIMWGSGSTGRASVGVLDSVKAKNLGRGRGPDTGGVG
ncbi:hypothetical protein NDU88_000257 [Pleurodeles waltl]|uniref:Uncharacterized protein n=1 Tax=Pleurodeles waltl TaxID=8319 RepID=A0AAV7SW41_PLEWA|nr:hypothetical protein NDU88_000257 [Pleurodeles waltl]